MEKIIYKEGCEGQNKLSCIEGIEIGLLNGQQALIFPKYSKETLLRGEQIDKWNARALSEIEALKVEDTISDTAALVILDSPAANWVFKFSTKDGRNFWLPSLLAAMEIQHQKEEIDALAETIEGADLLRDFTSGVWSCSRGYANGGWVANGNGGYAGNYGLSSAFLAVPTILYREEEI